MAGRSPLDTTEPYYFFPTNRDDVAAFVDALTALPRSERPTTWNLIFDDGADLTAAFTGGLAGTLSASVALADLAPLAPSVAFTGGLAGTLDAGVALGPSEVDAAFLGGLAGTLDAAVALGGAPDLPADATFTGGLAGTLAARVMVDLDVDAGFAGDLAGTLAGAITFLDALEADAAFTGGLVGTLAPAVALAPVPPKEIDTAFMGGLVGTLATMVRLGDVPHAELSALFTGGLVGTLAPTIDLGQIILNLWPRSVPSRFQQRGFRFAPIANIRATRVDRGPALRHRRYTRSRNSISGFIRMTPDEYAAFRTFYLDDLRSGKDAFTFPALFGPGDIEVEFAARPTRTPVDADWLVQISLRHLA